jgi:Glycosyltransferase family 87
VLRGELRDSLWRELDHCLLRLQLERNRVGRVETAKQPPGRSPWLVVFVAALVIVPTLFSIELLVFRLHHGNAFGDFTGSLWRPGHLIRAGMNPYPSLHSNLTTNPTDYPPFLLLLVGVPISFLGFHAGAFVWLAVLTLVGVALLKVLQVTDPRVWFVVLCSVPMVGASLAGNATPIIVLLVAIAWRYRDRALTCGIAVGAAIAVKLFVFPLLIWLAANRRWRALAAAVTSTVVFVFGSWAVIGFKGLLEYPRLLENVSKAQWAHSSSLYAFVVDVGGGRTLAQIAAVIAAVAVLVIWRGSFTSAVLASLLFSPVAWSFYYALLYVVAASASTRLSWRWLAPLTAAPTVFWGSQTRPAWLTAIIVASAVMACAPRPIRDRSKGLARVARARSVTS